MNRKITITTGVAVAIVLGMGLTACGDDQPGSSGDGRAEIQFFQSKSESVDTVNSMIADFEKDNPGIKVTQVNTPDAQVALQARLAKGQVPDVIAVNVNDYAPLVKAKVLTDQSGTEAAKGVTDKSAIDYQQRVGGADTLMALPWSTNSQVVLYNKDIYEELGLAIPTTWTELKENAQKIKDAGTDPFYFTWKDAWTATVVFNSVAGNLQGDDFQEKLLAGKTSFVDSPQFTEAAAKMLELKAFAQPDPSGKTYDDGNKALANGDTAMYIQGIWAIPEVLKTNPDANIGTFVLPVTDDASETVLIKGTDSVVGVSNSSEHGEAAQKFVDYLFSKEGQEKFSNEQHLFPVRSDVPLTDELLAPLKSDWIDTGRTAPYVQAVFSGSSELGSINQVFFADGDVSAYLKALDDDFAINGINQ